MNTFLLYVLTRLDPIAFVVGAVFITSVIIYMVLFVCGWAEGHPIASKKYLWVPVVSCILTVFIPTKQDAMFILAGTQIIELAKNPDIKRVAGKSAQVVEQYLDKMLENQK